MSKMLIEISGKVLEITEIHHYDGPGYDMIELENGTEWYIFEDKEIAGQAAREYWEDMAQNDQKEFVCMVGEDTLVAWALGHSAGPGSTAVNSLQDWLDLWLDTPEEHFASYDGAERDCRINKIAQDELSLPNQCVCYRHN